MMVFPTVGVRQMIEERITRLRELMKKEGVKAYLVPSTDPHSSEYVPECWQRRKWISGFTGSAGDVVITSDEGGLWTDGRYFIQAEMQLKGSGIRLFGIGKPDVPKMEDWIADELSEGDRIGVDPKVLSMDRARSLAKRLDEAGVSIKYIEKNLVDQLWDDRPSVSMESVRVLPDRFTGESMEDKIERIRGKMRDKGCSVHVMNALDSIAWTFNLRGSDVSYNPVFISYAVIDSEKAHLFIHPEKIKEDVRKHLGDHVSIHGYGDMGDFLEGIRDGENKVWLDPKTVNRWIRIKLGDDCRYHLERSPVVDFKSVKNRVELEGFREAHVRDGVAMVKFLKWLEETVPEGGVTEISAAEKLESFRREDPDLVGLSFETISAYEEHGAIVHYSATDESDVELKPQGIYLVDSGGQYLMGTTDITRTVTLGEPTDEQKEMFTRVLMGHMDLAMLRFPKGFSGKQIELPARKSLWDAGKNYNHGTGHGIGHYLNVHEGPIGITPRDPGVPLEAGQVLSDEPGYYKEGEYGIRIENLVIIHEDPALSSDDLKFLGFETITLCPIDLDLVNRNMLTSDRIEWLNDYHSMVRKKLNPLLDEEHTRWLEASTGRI
jgi:Xaa-Pro aminopeptidase